MIDLLNKLSEKYYLQLGDYKFSPITQLTAGISLEYSELLKKNECPKEPFIFCLPEKKAAALWTSISLLVNWYLEDYVSIGDEGISVKKNDKVLIYGCVAQVERVQNGDVYLRFKDQGGLELSTNLKPLLSLAKPTRTLNLLKQYIKARKEAKENRNPISKILYPNKEVIINQRNLKSKILLVAGRGQVKKFHDYLNTIEIYGKQLQKVFPGGENLLITPDLKRYKIDASSTGEINEEKFVELLKRALNKETFKDAKDAIKELIRLFENYGYITQEFDYLFWDMIDEFIEGIPQLKILVDNYPGQFEEFHSEIRAVVINDITQLIDYSNTIKFFLENGIPVVVFSDRNISNFKDIAFYNNLFQDKSNIFRLNWNKEKLRSLKVLYSTDMVIDQKECDPLIFSRDLSSEKVDICDKDVFIDHEIWNQAMRYERQVIKIDTFQGNSLDVLAPKLVKAMRELEEFEILQKSFYKNLFPAIYALKNSQNTSRIIKKLIAAFEYDLKSVIGHLPKETANDFLNTTRKAKEFSENTKEYESNGNVFSILLPIDLDETFSIPLGFHKNNVPDEKSESIIFTGYPFNEYRSNYLASSVTKYFVPEIELKCWPNEAALTYNYLRTRIAASYFYDHLPKGIDIAQELKIETEEDIESEIDRFLFCSEKTAAVDQSEEEIAYVYQFKYKGYLSSHDSSTTWKVNCDILNFENGDFMFVSRGSKILCLSEDVKGRMKVFKKSADQFLPGDIVFRYIKDRTAYLGISKRDPEVSKSYKTLETWRNELSNLYSRNEYSIKNLETFLINVNHRLRLNGNPVSVNLERWLFDEEVISPDEDNLRLILSAAEVPNIEERLLDLKKAYKIATAYRISLSTRIKKEISKKLTRNSYMNGGFKIYVDGETIEVETRIISSVDSNGIKVDYHNTRKILC